MKEREINLIDLLVDILLHWRMFIIWMLIGGILFGVIDAISTIRSWNVAQTEQKKLDEMEHNPEKWVSEEAIRNVNYVIGYEEACHAKEIYQAEAPLMRVDPNYINMAEATIVIEAEDYQESCNIEKVYEDIIQSSELVTKVAEENGMDTIGIKDMILLTKESSSSDVPTIERTNTFKVVTMYNNEVKSKKMLESVIAFLEEKQPDIKDALGEHKIIIINQSFGVSSDTKLADAQNKILAEIINLRAAASEAKKSLTDIEKRYYELLTKENKIKETEDVASNKEVAMFSISIKSILFGAALAMFFCAFIVFGIYIFNVKIRFTDNLQELYDIPQLGAIPNKRNYKNFGGVIDKWILEIRNRNKRQFTFEEALELAFVAVKMSIEKEKVQEICLVGCGLKGQMLIVCEEIKEGLGKKGIRANILNNILYDAQAMGELEGAEGIVLVEGANSTLYNEISEELKVLNRQEIKVLGGILVE